MLVNWYGKGETFISEIHHPYVPKSVGIRGLDELKIAYSATKEQKGEDGVLT